MPLAPTKVLTTAELLDDNLFRAMVPNNPTDDLSTINSGAADCRPVGPRDQQYSGEDQLAAGLARASVNGDKVSLADLKLVAPILENRVHPSPPLTSRGGCRTN